MISYSTQPVADISMAVLYRVPTLFHWSPHVSYYYIVPRGEKQRPGLAFGKMQKSDANEDLKKPSNASHAFLLLQKLVALSFFFSVS
jgi:hypothetical protein